MNFTFWCKRERRARNLSVDKGVLLSHHILKLLSPSWRRRIILLNPLSPINLSKERELKSPFGAEEVIEWNREILKQKTLRTVMGERLRVRFMPFCCINLWKEGSRKLKRLNYSLYTVSKAEEDLFRAWHHKFQYFIYNNYVYSIYVNVGF